MLLPVQHAAGGIFGLIAGMFVETILFITRTSMADKRSERKAKAELKAERVGLHSSTVPSVSISEVQTEDSVSVLEIQAEPEIPFGVRKRRGLVQPPG